MPTIGEVMVTCPAVSAVPAPAEPWYVGAEPPSDAPVRRHGQAQADEQFVARTDPDSSALDFELGQVVP
ncbi:MAG: hypothetical protein U0231_16520 [Nitrospiraceae bacterium]